MQRACNFRDNVNEVALGTDTITKEFKNVNFYRTDVQADPSWGAPLKKLHSRIINEIPAALGISIQFLARHKFLSNSWRAINLWKTIHNILARAGRLQKM